MRPLLSLPLALSLSLPLSHTHRRTFPCSLAFAAQLAFSYLSFSVARKLNHRSSREHLLPRLLTDLAAALDAGTVSQAAPAAGVARGTRSEQIPASLLPRRGGLARMAVEDDDECERHAVGTVGGWGVVGMLQSQVHEVVQECAVALGAGTKG